MPFPHETDLRILEEIGLEIERQIKAGLSPEQLVEVEVPPEITAGYGILPLLDLLYGIAGEAETMRRMDIGDTLSLLHYLDLFSEAIQSKGLTEAVLRGIHERNCHLA